METDKKRIEVGNSKFPSIRESKTVAFKDPFDFSSEDITFDSVERTFDEQ